MTQTCKYFWGDEPCNRPLRSKKNQMCRTHLSRYERGGELNAPLQEKVPGKVCSSTIDGQPCGRKHEGHGLCHLHLGRLATNYSMDAPVKVMNSGRGCSGTFGDIPCENAHHANGLCMTHDSRSRNPSDNMSAPLQVLNPDRGCSSTTSGEPCERKHFSLGFCSMHYNRSKLGFDMDTPIRIVNQGRSCSATTGGEPCERQSFSIGYCSLHYNRSKHNLDMDAPIITPDGEQGCSATIDGEPCDRPHKLNGLCRAHDRRSRFELDMDAPWGTLSSGYDSTKPSTLYVAIHTGLMSSKIGKSTNPVWRFNSHETNGWEIVWSKTWEDGTTAQRVETVIKRWLKDAGCKSSVKASEMPQGGYTETTSFDDLSPAEFLGLVEEFTVLVAA